MAELEPVPYEILIPEMERALHEGASERVLLRGQIEMRNRDIAQRDARIAELAQIVDEKQRHIDRLLELPAPGAVPGGLVPGSQPSQDHVHGDGDL